MTENTELTELLELDDALQETSEKEPTPSEKKPRLPAYLWGIGLFVLLLIVDLVTKIAAEKYFSGDKRYDSIDIIPGWISLRLTYNDGIAYGIGGDSSPVLKIFVIILTAVMMAALAFLYFKIDKRRVFLRVALVLVVAGGVGNLIDRLWFKVWEADCALGVRDMVDLSRFGFAVCNFADFFISIGAVMLVCAFLFFDRDAFFPQGKYKALAKEAAEAEERKKALKVAETETLQTLENVENPNGMQETELQEPQIEVETGEEPPEASE